MDKKAGLDIIQRYKALTGASDRTIGALAEYPDFMRRAFKEERPWGIRPETFNTLIAKLGHEAEKREAEARKLQNAVAAYKEGLKE